MIDATRRGACEHHAASSDLEFMGLAADRAWTCLDLVVLGPSYGVGHPRFPHLLRASPQPQAYHWRTLPSPRRSLTLSAPPRTRERRSNGQPTTASGARKVTHAGKELHAS
jgi:hypothetical protein